MDARLFVRIGDVVTAVRSSFFEEFFEELVFIGLGGRAGEDS